MPSNVFYEVGRAIASIFNSAQDATKSATESLKEGVKDAKENPVKLSIPKNTGKVVKWVILYTLAIFIGGILIAMETRVFVGGIPLFVVWLFHSSSNKENKDKTD